MIATECSDLVKLKKERKKEKKEKKEKKKREKKRPKKETPMQVSTNTKKQQTQKQET
jgi:hypothetical protein